MGAIDRVFRGRRGGQERPIAAIVAGLWRNGEQGVWYDPSDLSTMYQDAAGTTPCYLPGQGLVDPPVGLLLDKRLGLARGPERLVNGDFSAGAAGWNVSGNDATHIATFSGGTLRFQSDTTSPVMLVQQLGAMVVGRWYEITVTVSAWVSGSLKSDNFVQTGLPLASGAGVYKVIGLSAGTTFAFLRASANVDITIDSISLREVLGNHAYQVTTTCRPTLSARYNQFLSTESLSNAAWLKSGGGLGLTPTVSDNYGAAPDGTNTAARVSLTLGGGTSSADLALLYQVTSIPDSRQVWWLKTADGSTKTVYIRGTTASTFVVTGDWAQYSIATGTTAGTQTGIGLRGGQVPACSDTADLLVWHPNVATANDGVGLPPYQRVVDANTYDTAGFPLYLKPDGVDDGMQTANIDFNGFGEVLVAAAIRKLSDSARGFVCELGADTNLSFGMAAPNGVNSTVSFYSRGTVQRVVEATQPAPVSLIAVGQGVIRDDISKVRINGVPAVSSSADQGTGDYYGNLPLFIGRRGGLSLPFGGRLYGVLIRGAATPDATIAKVERHLNSKARAY